MLLSRYSMEEDIVVGTVDANRAEPELEGVMGCIAHPYAIRTDLSGALPPRDCCFVSTCTATCSQCS